MPARRLTLLLLATLLVSCATSPMGRRQLTLMPADQMDTMGLEAFSSLKSSTPVESDPATNRYVRCVAERITAQIGGEWEVVVFQDDSANAFALPGGKIGVHTGLLKVAKNQDQLATVLAHEVAHVLANHANERVSQEYAVNQGLALAQQIGNPQSSEGQALMGLLGVGAKVGILLPFSRTQESESDLYGLDLMAKAGFDPAESVQLWYNMAANSDGEPPAFLSTHPSHSTRIADLQKRIPSARKLYQQAQAAGRRPSCQ